MTLTLASENNLQKSVPSFRLNIGSRDRTQIIRLVQQAFYLLNHLSNPRLGFLFHLEMVSHIAEAGPELMVN